MIRGDAFLDAFLTSSPHLTSPPHLTFASPFLTFSSPRNRQARADRMGRFIEVSSLPHFLTPSLEG